MKRLLVAEGYVVGRRHITTTMRRVGIEAPYRTALKATAHTFHPYLLRGLTIRQPGHVWTLDITYIPMQLGSVYFAAVMDWTSRRILSWRLSNTMTADFCVEALEEAILIHGALEIVNTDQDSQFTRGEFVAAVQGYGGKVCMNGKGAWRDNVFIERF